MGAGRGPLGNLKTHIEADVPVGAHVDRADRAATATELGQPALGQAVERQVEPDRRPAVIGDGHL